jgi:hypothetical protein
MKTKSLVALVLAAASVAVAAPLMETTAVHTKPDASSPAISYLKAGTQPPPATGALADTPVGWMAVELPGPFEGYVASKDLTKGLEVKPGAPIRLSPNANSGVLLNADRGTHTTITGIHGKWTQLSVAGPLVGYINIGGAGSYTAPMATAPAASAAAATVPYAGPEAASAVVPPSTAPGQPAVQSSAQDSATLPRQLTGKFVSTRSLLHPRRPYDWALVDNSGKRIAYLDISKLLLTERIEKYMDHFVVVFGAAKPVPETNDIVIQIDTLELLLR